MPDGSKSREQLLQEWRERRARAAAAAASSADGSRQSGHAASSSALNRSGSALARPSVPSTREAPSDAQTAGPLTSGGGKGEPHGDSRSGQKAGEPSGTSSSGSEGSASKHGTRPPLPRAVRIAERQPAAEHALESKRPQPPEASSVPQRRSTEEHPSAGRWHQLQAPTPPPSLPSRTVSESSSASKHGATPQPSCSVARALAEGETSGTRHSTSSSARKEAAPSWPQAHSLPRTQDSNEENKPSARSFSQRLSSPDDEEADGVGSIAARLRWLKRESVLASGPAANGTSVSNGGSTTRTVSWDQAVGRGAEIEAPSSSGPGSLRRLAASMFDEDQEWCAAVSHGLHAQLTRSRDGATDEIRIRELAELVKLLRRTLRQAQSKMARFVEAAVRIERDAEMYVESAKLAGESEASALASELAKARREAAAAAADRSADRAALQVRLGGARDESIERRAEEPQRGRISLRKQELSREHERGDLGLVTVLPQRRGTLCGRSTKAKCMGTMGTKAVGCVICQGSWSRCFVLEWLSTRPILRRFSALFTPPFLASLCRDYRSIPFFRPVSRLPTDGPRRCQRRSCATQT